jgi:hypothetical protein
MNTLDPEYVRQRRADPDMLVRDVGLAIASSLQVIYGAPRVVDLALDSEQVREYLAEGVVAELQRAGYRLEFVG